jgi:hypothetical protein
VSHPIHITTRFFVLAAAFLAAGCGGSASVKPTAPPPCETRVVATHPADTVTVVVFDKIDLSHAPWPRNREERFVFSHLYETLVKVDCRGVVQPGLAKSWKKASDGWYIELQEDAHFWDDSMVTTDDVKTSLEPVIHDGLAIGPVDIVDETHAIIHGDFDLGLLAFPMFAIRKGSNASRLPIGTGPWMIDTRAGAGDVVLRPVAGRVPVVRVTQVDAANTMDVLGGSADAVITDNPTAIDYAHTKPHAAIFPLAWDNAYFLMSPSLRFLAPIPRSLSDELAKNVVAIDSRGGSGILAASPPCGQSGWDVTMRGGDFKPAAHVFYLSTDPTSRALAERLVALASMDTVSSADARTLLHSVPDMKNATRAVGLTRPELEQALRNGSDVAYLVALSWCSEFPMTKCWLRDHAPWSLPYNRDHLAHSALPLVETRAHFIAMTDRISYIDEQNGTVRIMPPGVERVR